MKDIVEIEINVPQAAAAGLFSDPANNTKWMEGLKSYEALSGEPGVPGSKYRLVPKSGDRVFVVTVVKKELPRTSELALDAPNMTVSVSGRFIALSAQKTKLVSEEIFAFKGIFGKLFGVLAWPAIRRAHRRQMEAFKRFAENKVSAA
jgi:hypothetical protein